MLKYENNDVFTGTFDHGVLNRKGRLALAEENGLATHGTKVSHVVMILTERKSSNQGNLLFLLQLFFVRVNVILTCGKI